MQGMRGAEQLHRSARPPRHITFLSLLSPPFHTPFLLLLFNSASYGWRVALMTQGLVSARGFFDCPAPDTGTQSSSDKPAGVWRSGHGILVRRPGRQLGRQIVQRLWSH